MALQVRFRAILTRTRDGGYCRRRRLYVLPQDRRVSSKGAQTELSRVADAMARLWGPNLPP